MNLKKTTLCATIVLLIEFCMSHSAIFAEAQTQSLLPLFYGLKEKTEAENSTWKLAENHLVRYGSKYALHLVWKREENKVEMFILDEFTPEEATKTLKSLRNCSRKITKLGD
jgi:hypothetical protein